ncbi:MAG: HAD-IA family hydrolase [Desulfobacterales bacterium]|nr:HAD-IA family hydrolase [Desulfobacterales bacterium]
MTSIVKFAHYIFDWGDTLMVDFPDTPGPMCLWDKVAAVEGARETLAALNQRAGCYLATNAQDSRESDIIKALERVGLTDHIDRVFCFENVGYRKPSLEFFKTILKAIGASPSQTVMVGDSLDTDVAGALAAGLHGIWYNPSGLAGTLPGAGVIRRLTALVEPSR